MFDLQRFIEAQEVDYPFALAEIKNGRKDSHWMWYIFPQIVGLGFSSTSQFYAIQNIAEAAAYLKHPVLGQRLVEITTALLELPTNDARQVFGFPDDMKLRSSMTLFLQLKNISPTFPFQKVLNKFFNGQPDEQTLQILKKSLKTENVSSDGFDEYG